MHPKERLAQYEIEPKKSLGQNFLFDDHILANIVAAADVAAADQVLEVGPGIGSLTRHLAAAARRVVAVELDQRLFPILEQELAGFSNVELVHADILTFDPAVYFHPPTLLVSESPVSNLQSPVSNLQSPVSNLQSPISSLQSPVSNYKVIANVPYYITGAILRHLLGARVKPSCMVLTVQKEVAVRLTAAPPDMSLLAVSVQVYGKVEVVMTVKAGAFWPRPGVDSAVVRITLDPRLLGSKPAFDEKSFFRIVRAGFSQKRKQLKNNLKGLGYGEAVIEQALSKVGIDGRRRAETLAVDEWHRLCAAFGNADSR